MVPNTGIEDSLALEIKLILGWKRICLGAIQVGSSGWRPSIGVSSRRWVAQLRHAENGQTKQTSGLGIGNWSIRSSPFSYLSLIYNRGALHQRYRWNPTTYWKLLHISGHFHSLLSSQVLIANENPRSLRGKELSLYNYWQVICHPFSLICDLMMVVVSEKAIPVGAKSPDQCKFLIRGLKLITGLSLLFFLWASLIILECSISSEIKKMRGKEQWTQVKSSQPIPSSELIVERENLWSWEAGGWLMQIWLD